MGVGRRDITPEIGGQLFGYGGGTVSAGVDDPLRATAIWMSCGGTAAILVSAEVCLVNTALSDRTRAAVAAATGVDAKNVILSATHTHSGPNTAGTVGWGDYDTAYCEAVFIPRVVEAAAEAARSPRPARMGVAAVRSETGVNRREIVPEGWVRLGNNPWGAFDAAMTVLSLAEPGSGKPVLTIAHYGAHCTAAFRHPFVSRDWAGAMLDMLERETGAPAVFLQGASGDVAPRMANAQAIGGPGYAREVGHLAGLDAMRALRSVKAWHDTGLETVSGDFALPLKPRIPPEEARDRLARATPGSREEDYYGRVAASYRDNAPERTHFAMPQTLLALGDVALVPFPFEVFSEISLRLRHYSPFQHTLCLSATNGSNGYLPTQEQICRGGYEIEVARTESVWPWVDDLDTLIIRENLNLLEKLKCTASDKRK